jgi:glycosyltransferase involved in cell wall biosynthesis
VSGAAPPVSIGLPVYNGERYLEIGLDAILGQTYTDFELVIADNASTDATEEMCRAAAARDPRVRYLRAEENRGAAWNFNRVFHESTGRYFRWAAYDDLIAETYFERLVDALDAAPDDVVLVQSLTSLIDEEGQPAGDYDEQFDLSHGSAAHRLGDLVRHLVMGNALFGLMRRDALDRTRLHGAYASSDYVLLAELALLGRFVYVPERLFLRRVHPAMSRRANRKLSEVADFFEPGAGRTVRSEFWRLFGEHLIAIKCSPIGVGARAGATAVFVPFWLMRHRRMMTAELLAAARPRRGR